VPTAYEVVSECRKFEKPPFKGTEVCGRPTTNDDVKRILNAELTVNETRRGGEEGGYAHVSAEQ
jgi:hypothetical protein